VTGDYTINDPSANSSAHFVTPYATPDPSTLHATADMIVTDPGGGTWNLVISHGCAGGTTPPPASPLTISKTAAGDFTTAYKWDIAKAVDKTEIDTADGNATFKYTVTVTHDAGTNSNVGVSGNIDVSNPDVGGVVISSLADQLSDGTVCTVDTSGRMTLAHGDNLFPYSCSLGALPTGQLNNTATVNWADQTLSDGSVLAGDHADFTVGNIQFTQHLTNSTVTVTDPLGGGVLGTVDATKDPSSVDFPYSHTFSGDPAGTCTPHVNTATINETGQSASQSVKMCVGADLAVSKDAKPSFNRTYNWNIAKAADKTTIEPGGKVNYTVTVNQNTQNPFTDSGWLVKGAVTVNNPNDWEPVTLGSLSDAINNGGTCSFDNAPAGTVIPANGSATFPYTCTYSQAPSPLSGSNTATASWDASAAFTADNSASGSKDFAFGNPTNTVNQTIHVTDTQGGALGTAGPATDSAPFASQQFTYSKTFSPPASGCATVNNTATITETQQNASASVKNCNTGALTMGYWQNKNGQALITGATQADLAAFLKGYAPFQDLGSQTVATYVTNVIKAANASGASMNAMLKAQMLSAALDVYFSDPAHGNKINAPAPIGGVTVDLTHICKMIDGSGGTATCSGTYENVSGAFGGATSLTVSQMLASAATQSNAGGSAWYGQVKTTQQLAKDAFDAINNQVASGP
jgi:hypothetical protein